MPLPSNAELNLQWGCQYNEPHAHRHKYLHKKWWSNTRQAESTSQDLKFVLGEWFVRDYLLIYAENGGGDLNTWALKYNLPLYLGKFADGKQTKDYKRRRKKRNTENYKWEYLKFLVYFYFLV